MKALTLNQVLEDNPHFGHQIRVVESGPYKSAQFDFTEYKTVGSCDATAPWTSAHIDAWATYLWSPTRGWVLGAN
jgi:hypothetical protein